MKKILALLFAATMLFSFAACSGDTDVTEPADTQGETTQADTTAYTKAEADTTAQQTEVSAEVPKAGTPIGWPQNEYTALIPTPDVGGKALSEGDMIGELFTVDLEWTIEQGTAYAQQLADAGFGDDCAEKFEKYGYIDRTANGVNVQILDLFGKVNISIMKTEETT